MTQRLMTQKANIKLYKANIDNDSELVVIKVTEGHYLSQSQVITCY